MTDSAIVASIVAGEPAGLAAAYDKYADDLYGYCQSLLREPDDAADAVQDTFVVAAAKLGGLRDPARLRAWLFAVARNECLHRLKSRRTAASLSDAPDRPDETVDVGAGAERAETIALMRAAVGGLNNSERDVINQLWHGLEVPEVADVLGVSRNHAYSLFSRARDQLEASVGVLLVGRAGRGDCTVLNALLGDWDGQMTALLRKRIGRHIDHCTVCSDRRRREFTPALLYGLSAGAVLGLGTLRGGSLGRALIPASQTAATSAAAADATGHAAMTFRGDGFPRPAHYGHLSVLHNHPLPLAAAATAAAATAAAVLVAVFVLAPHARPGAAAGPPGSTLTGSASVPGGQPPASSGGARGTQRATAGPGSTQTGAAAGPGAGGSAGASGSPGAASTSRAGTGSGSTGSGSTGSAGTGSGGTGTAGGGGTTAAGGGSGSGTGSGASLPASSAPAPAPANPAPASSAPAAGTLSVSPTTVLLTPLLGGSLTLTASGGPVSWSISEPASLIGKLTVSSSSGTLSAGSSVTVSIGVSGLASVDTTLTVEPGGHAVTVVLGLA